MMTAKLFYRAHWLLTEHRGVLDDDVMCLQFGLSFAGTLLAAQ
jgi:hypothetical protein